MPDGERRLAAIMYTDIVGYTALTQRDESSTLQALEKHRSLLRPHFSSHGGREIKTIGDAFLVEFQSALDAVLCAVAVQQTMHDRKVATGETISLRIGIHVGDVVEKGNDILGDAVNIASRIEPLAEPGGVCITDEVYRQVRNKSDLPYVSIGEKTLKNVSRSVEVYKVQLPWEQSAAVGAPSYALNRVAILPFASFSPDPNDAYFADGITDEIISAAAGISGLKVISRTSVVGYKGTTKKIDEIGRELKVGSILEGTFKKAGNRIRVTTQLIKVADDEHLWAQNYDRNLDDIFEVQSDVAKQVAEALRVRILAPEKERVERKPTESTVAYTLYLKGRSLWNKRDKEGVVESVKFFQEAIRIDPSYARAFSGLADSYNIAAERGFMDLTDGRARANDAAKRALELDDLLAEAHASLGLYLWSDLKWEEAQREFRRAIELNPSYASAHQWYSQCLLEVGRKKEAREEAEKAHTLDPQSPIITNTLATLNFYDGEFDEVIAIADKLLEADSSSSFGHWLHFAGFLNLGIKEKAYSALEAYHEVQDDQEQYKYGLVCLYAVFGEGQKALPIIEELIPKVGARGSSVSEGEIAECYAMLGDGDECFKWIDKAIARKRISVTELRYCPGFTKVRNDPRIPEIFKKLGLQY